jgi:hypothetical protein
MEDLSSRLLHITVPGTSKSWGLIPTELDAASHVREHTTTDTLTEFAYKDYIFWDPQTRTHILCMPAEPDL